ncbi:cellulose synthase complex periplasmic endoglucanase BcsZ [uncultured Shewanella sp.]|uniref:cellulose synthase complex periplasmic endoglucanase BcsZ n=1 Tax=uncultured Shewanella sp. TaxID=173975 RepID=UPI0026188B4E|nr:cellulose synthase complex periplasmic endoglucanase BcsZ [uncultured Shewanella sp.]
MIKWILLLCSFQLNAAICWPDWQQFKNGYIEQGRVIDRSDARLISTSEGQSYGLFFALVANDPDAFASILSWTEDKLAQEDLTARLPAWLWGKKEEGIYSVIDNNTASDSDLWIAYTLAEAGRLWNNYYYQSLGFLLASRILREETRRWNGNEIILLPGMVGFEGEDGSYRLNPSYVPLQLLQRMQVLYPQYPWGAVYQSSFQMLIDTMPKGFSPDWVLAKNGGYYPDKQTVGSFNAIRTYLWAGMLNDELEDKAVLIKKMSPMITAVSRLNAPPLTVNTQTGHYTQEGGEGFSAAILPLLVSAKRTKLASFQAKRAQNVFQRGSDKSYYDNVLALFGLGWFEQRYRFGVTGELLPNWTDTCSE